MALKFTVDEAVALWRRSTHIATLVSGRLNVVAGTGRVSASAVFGQKNLARQENVRVRREFFADFSQGVSPVIQSTSADVSDEGLRATGPCSDVAALLREAADPKGGAGSKTLQCLEIWREGRLQHSWDLAQFDVHGRVYTDATFGCFEFSPDERHLVYVAEKKAAKKQSFLQLGQVAAAADDDNRKKQEDPATGAEYELVEDWGEQLVGKSQPVVCVFDVDWEVGCGRPSPVRVFHPTEEFSPGQVTWTSSDQLVGVGWSHKPRRLGLIYCTNRSSQLFRLGLSTGHYEWLGEAGNSVASPRCHGPSKRLAFLTCASYGPHHKEQKIALREADGSQRTVEVSADADVYRGMYDAALIERCWSPDGRHLVLTTPFKSSVQSYIVDLDEQRVTRLSLPDGCTGGVVLDVAGDWLLLNGVSLTRPDRLYVGRVDWRAVDRPLQWTRLCSGDGLPAGRPMETDLEAFRFPDGTEYESTIIFARPTQTTGPADKLGLVVCPHGGPHSASPDLFRRDIWFFNQLGLAVLLVNYRGSTGFGEKSLHSLPGNIGVQDVADVHQATVRALEKHAELLDADQVYLYGGSHGGFLVTHLAGQHADFYRAVATRNPVIDLTTMLPISDIADWVVVESGLGDGRRLEDVLDSPAALEAMWQRSPIRYVHQVRAPVLLLVGKVDLRVPPSQAMEYHRALKLHGRARTRLLEYDDCHPLAKLPVDADATINTVLWFRDASAGRS